MASERYCNNCKEPTLNTSGMCDKCSKQIDINIITENDLMFFTGTEHYYKGYCGVLYTEGIMYLIKNGLSWLITDICSYMVKPEIKNMDFQSWNLKVNPDKSAILTLSDGNDNIILTQNYTYTDCPLNEIKLYLIDNILLLTSEY